MPLCIHPRQRLLFSRSAHGEILSLHGSGDATIRLLLKTPILYDLSPMTFPYQHGCYLWEGTLVEESEVGQADGEVTNRFWPGALREICQTDLPEVFLSFGDEVTGQSILMATYEASFGEARVSTER